MRIHFVAIGGAAMHNLAIALHKKGYTVSGSDDEIFDPASSNLAKHGLLPGEFGWFPDRITKDLDAVILGMHAREDNPEFNSRQRNRHSRILLPPNTFTTRPKTRPASSLAAAMAKPRSRP